MLFIQSISKLINENEIIPYISPLTVDVLYSNLRPYLQKDI